MSTGHVKKRTKAGSTLINQYIVAKKLGKGSFSTVKLCTDKNTGTKYAIK